MGNCLGHSSNHHVFSEDIPLKSAEENRAIVASKLNITNLKDSQNALLAYIWDEDVMFCISDALKEDMPIHYASDYFCKFTGYSRDEIIGKNCRFLQGPQTAQKHVDRIRESIANEKPGNMGAVQDFPSFVINSVCFTYFIFNIKRKFMNQFYIAPIYNQDNVLAYYLGIQTRITLMSFDGQEVEQSNYFNASQVLATVVRKTCLAKDFSDLFSPKEGVQVEKKTNASVFSI